MSGKVTRYGLRQVADDMKQAEQDLKDAEQQLKEARVNLALARKSYQCSHESIVSVGSFTLNEVKCVQCNYTWFD